MHSATFRPRPENTVAAKSDLAVHVFSRLVIDRYGHGVQVGTSRVLKVIGAVEGDVQIVLAVRSMNQFGCRSAVRVFRARTSNCAPLSLFCDASGTDSRHHIRRVAHDLQVGDVFVAVCVVVRGNATVHRTVAQCFFKQYPVFAVGRDPSQCAAPDLGAGALVLIAQLLLLCPAPYSFRTANPLHCPDHTS